MEIQSLYNVRLQKYTTSMNKKVLKNVILRYNVFVSAIFRLFGMNKKSISGKSNIIKDKGTFLRNCYFKIKGNENTINIEGGITRLKGCRFLINGSNCQIKIDRDCNLNNVVFYLQDDYCKIEVGKHVTISGKTELAVIEGKSITIGKECLFSDDIEFRVGDSHSILDMITHKRINPSKDISIGDHVWIGHGVKVLKGSNVSENTIVATGAILTGKTFPKNSIIGGVPGKVLRDNVDWCAERLEMNNKD